MESKWLKESLFAGMTAHAFKLGTVLTLGWFWSRISGCSVLYRGSSMETVDFDNILAVSERNAFLISPASYVQHSNSSTYFYIIRRANSCGYEESTLDASVKVSIDSNGDVTLPSPNDIFGVKVERNESNRIRLIWYYCPIEQKSGPECFNVYCDDGTGQIDYEDPIAVIYYSGRKFYNFQSDALEEGRYLFAIRTEDTIGTEDGSLAHVGIQLETAVPDAINILSTEVI